MFTRGPCSGRVPDGDKWPKATQDTLGGSEVSEANGVLLNPCHPPNAEKREADR